MKKYITYLEFAVEMYVHGLKLINPKKDDYSILSGCMLLMVGLEKLVKHALKTRNPLLILEKISFDSLIDLELGNKKFENIQTASLNASFQRLCMLYPALKNEEIHIARIIKARGFLYHSEGYYDLSRIESDIRVNVTDISESICKECLNREPQKIFGKKTWSSMKKYRDAYKESEALELKERITFLKRLHKQRKKLPCEPIKENGFPFEECPICKNDIEIAFDFDIDYDHEGGVFGGQLFPKHVICPECGFSLKDIREIEALFGEDVIRQAISDYADEERRGYDYI